MITHDLRLAERLGGRLALLYASRIVEVGPTAAFFAAPSHPYGRELLRALPEREGKPIPGLPPELTALPAGCAFADRCPDRFDRCTTVPARPLPRHRRRPLPVLRPCSALNRSSSASAA